MNFARKCRGLLHFRTTSVSMLLNTSPSHSLPCSSALDSVRTGLWTMPEIPVLLQASGRA